MTEGPAPEPRQRVVRARTGRRAKLTPAPGTTAEPVPADETTDAVAPANGEATASGAQTSGPNDERLRRDVPPHY